MDLRQFPPPSPQRPLAHRLPRRFSRAPTEHREVPMPYILLVHGVQRGLLQGKGNFDEAEVVSHARIPPTTRKKLSPVIASGLEGPSCWRNGEAIVLA